MNGRSRWAGRTPQWLRPPAVLARRSLLVLAGGALVLASGHDPLHAYAQIVVGLAVASAACPTR